MKSLAAIKNVPAAQLALAWVLSKPAVVAPVIGATEISHVLDAVSALTIQLTQNEIERLEGLYQIHPVLINQ